MDNKQAIEIIRKEYLCVSRECDIERSCGKCDLMMPSKEPILEAYKMAMDALAIPSAEPKTEQWKDFAIFVAKEIFYEWEYNKDAFAEIACRKLNKLGIVKANGDQWELAEPYEGMTNGDVVETEYPGLSFSQDDEYTYYGHAKYKTSWWNALYKGEQS